MEFAALVIIYWGWIGPLIAIWISIDPVCAVLMVPLTYWAHRNRGRLSLLIKIIFFVLGGIALANVGGLIALSVILCWGLVFLSYSTSY